MGWTSSGSASTSGGPTVYSVSWTAPTYSFPPGSSYQSVTSTGGDTSINCGTSTTRTYYANWYQYGFWDSDQISVTATAPACAPTQTLFLTASLTSNDGTSPGAYPGIAYSFTAYNTGAYPVVVTWSIPGLGLETSYTLGVGSEQRWFSNGFLGASYGTTYTGTISGSGSTGPVSVSSSATTPAPPTYPPSWSDSSLAGTFRVGEAYSDSVSASGNPTPSYAITSGSLPAGVSLNSSTGAVTGTPTTAGAYSFTIQASNGVGTPVNAAFSGTVATPRGELNYWSGTAWVQEPIRTWDSSAWATAIVYTFNGTEWVKSF